MNAPEQNDAPDKFEAMWREVEQDFKKQTGRSLRGTGKAGDREDLAEQFLAKLEHRDVGKEDSDGRKQKAREVLGAFLDFIQVIGSFAGSVAKMAFGGPAELSFNAFKFLIEIPKKVGSIYDGLVELYKEITAILAEFRVLEQISKAGEIDEEVLTTSHNVLVAFVNICGKHIKVLESPKIYRIRVTFKSMLLDNDSGVQKELNDFKALVRRQNSMIDTMSYKHQLESKNDQKVIRNDVEDIRGGIEDIRSSTTHSQIKFVLQTRLKFIEERLNLPLWVADHHLAVLSQRQHKVAHKACEWVYETMEYETWMNQESQKPLLCIAGNENTGKASLLAAVARKLKTTVHTDQAKAPAPVVAFYDFVIASVDKSHLKRGDGSVEIALKALALQIAREIPEYARYLENSLLRTDLLEERDISRLWNYLKFTELPKPADQAVYIVLYGLDQLAKDRSTVLLDLLADGKHMETSWPKILVAGSISSFAGIGGPLILKVEEHNEPGIRWYIDNEMRQTNDLQGSHERLRGLRRAIIEQLPSKVHGNFVAVRQKLDHVTNAVQQNKTEEEVLVILGEDPETDLERKMATSINKLQNKLNADEIEDINLMLPWLVYGTSPPSIEQLEAILLSHGRPIPVRPLQNRLEKEYEDMLTTRANRVFLNKGFKKFFESGNVQPVIPSIEGSKSSLKIEIHHADKGLVRRVLWDLSERFDFNDPQFTDTKFNIHRSRIGVDAARSHFFMVKMCLGYFSEEINPDTKVLGLYSGNVFVHLKSLQKLMPAAEYLNVICQKLINFFEEPSALEHKIQLTPAELQDWISHDTMRAIEGVFNTATQSTIFEPRDRRWIEKKIRSKTCRGDFWKPITLMMAKNWLQDYLWSADFCFNWINAFIELQSEPMGEDCNETENITENANDRSQDSDIFRATSWCASNLDVDASSALYHERLAITLLKYGEVDKAKELLEKARRLSEPDWHIHRELASAYISSERYADAKKHLESAIQQLELSDQREEEQDALVDLLWDLAHIQRSSHETEAALRSYEQLLEIDPFRNDIDSYEDLCFKESFRFLRIGDDARARDLICGKDQIFINDIDALQKRLEAAYGHYPADTAAAYWLVAVMRDGQIADQIEEALKRICQKKRSDDNPNIPSHWFYISGIVFCRLKHLGLYEKGIECLEECRNFAAAERPPAYADIKLYPRIVRRKAIRQLCTWKLLSISAMKPDHRNFGSEQKDFENFTKESSRSFEFSGMPATKTPLTFLCRYYTLNEEHERARELVKQDVREGLDILEDDDPDNDTSGYKLLAEAFKCVGDDIGALIAWSQMTPTDIGLRSGNDTTSSDTDDAKRTDKENDSATQYRTRPNQDHRPGNLTYACDGICGRRWYYADDIWSCKHCFDVQFCSDCHKSLKEGQLRRLICHPEHEFLHVPPWSDAEHFAVGGGHVRVEGELSHDGRIIHGRIIRRKEWLDRIHRDWNIQIGLDRGSQEEGEN